MRKHILLAPVAALLFASCEKVINVDLNDAAPQYVVEGEVYSGNDTVKVHVAKTTDYYGFAPQQQINDAVVLLTDDQGNNTTIPFTGNGQYQLPGFNGVPGRRYFLKVTVAGQEFNATSVMPQMVGIDSVSRIFKEADFRKEGYEVAANFTDPAGTKNFYRVVYTINDTLQNQPKDLYLLNDKYNDGKLVKADLFRRFEPGDKIAFELRGMDEAVFDFFTSLNEMLNNQNGPAPANPNSNITGGALGYFGAFTRSIKSTQIP